MASDAKNNQGPPPPAAADKVIRIYSYPKVFFIIPTFVVALLCAIAMAILGDPVVDPLKADHDRQAAQTGARSNDATTAPAAAADQGTNQGVPPRRFKSAQNVLGMAFLLVLFLNVLIMSLDFPRFTVLGVILAAFAMAFFLMWLNVYWNLVPPFVNALERIYVAANSGFYAMVALVLGVNLLVIYMTRFLDYWEIRPNEILHNHGPWSDLERFPTYNLKFDKEIPDIFEYALFGAGRLTLHMGNERRAFVLENVLGINRIEAHLKNLMSRSEVRITTDQEAAEPM